MTTPVHQNQRLEIWIPGIPAPQGSKRLIRGRLIESSKKVKPWREAVTKAIQAEWGNTPPIDAAVTVTAEFLLPRHKTHYRSGAHSGELKPWAKHKQHRSTPDLDKLQRSTGDAITASGIIRDDCEINQWKASRRYAPDPLRCGANLTIYPTPTDTE